MTDVLVNYLA